MCDLSLNITQHWRRSAVYMVRSIPVGYWRRRSGHVRQPSWEVVRRGMPVVAVFHWVSFPSPTLVTLTALFLLVLPDPVSLIMAPCVVCRRTSIFIKESVVTSPALVLARAEH